MNDNHEKILTALSRVPLASTQQLAVLNQSLNSRKKASRLCRELEQDGLLKGMWHGKCRVWTLSKRGRKLKNITRTKSLKNFNHTLAIAQLYFDLGCPDRFLFEPAHKFSHLGKTLVWEPDAVYVHDKKVWCAEVQLTPLSSGRWSKKWKVYSDYFNNGHFEKARFQEWSSKPILPRFVVYSDQSEETIRNGFNVKSRELSIISRN